ncbi:MAG: hypothetical protein HY303_17455 [Candidatus Wallbacteria bacterium]|nr:hypothetical protein [Candidatus Wallbacteria bacterium]
MGETQVTLESFLVLSLLFGWVVHRHHALGLRLAEAEARVRANAVLPLMRQADRRLPW